MTKYCIDCRWAGSSYGSGEVFCDHPGSASLVDRSPPLAKTIRYDERYCGVLGRWWQEKPPSFWQKLWRAR